MFLLSGDLGIGEVYQVWPGDLFSQNLGILVDGEGRSRSAPCPCLYVS
jgi:hypothetical protein